MANEANNLKGRLVGNGRYQVGNLLGQGGMADVYKARDLNLQTDVVVKIPKMQILQDVTFKGRFDREIRALVELQHPHIIKVNDYGLHSGMPFFVMPFMGGGNLDDRRPRDPHKNYLPMQLDQVKPWVEPIAAALDFIYRKNFAHRDIKPENILFDQNDNVYVSDLGIAKALGKATPEQQGGEMTKTGMVIGTPEYMAPELIMGKDYDGRVDQYALAVLIYELLAGRVPFKGNNATATLVKHTTEQVPPVTVFNPNLPPQAWGALQKALSKQKEARFKTCQELVKALYSVSANPPPGGIVAPKPRGKRADCPFCRRPFLVPSGSMDKALRCPSCKKVIPKPKIATPPPMPGPVGPGGHIQVPGEPVPPVTPPGHNPRGMSQIQIRQRRTISVKPKRSRRLMWTCIAVGLMLVVGFMVWFFISGKNPVERQIADGDRNFYENADYDKAMTNYQNAIDAHPKRPIGHSKLGDLRAELGDYKEAMDDHEEAVALAKNTEVAYTYRGLTHERMGSIAKALKDFNAAIDENGDYWKAYWARSHLYARTGELTKAVRDAEQALDLIGADNADAHNHRATANLLIGLIRRDNSYYEKALANCNDALNERPDFLPAIITRSWAHQENGNHEGALKDAQSATKKHPKLAAAHYNLGQICGSQNQMDNAINALDKAIQRNPNDVWLYVERGLLREKNGELDEARKDLDLAIQKNSDFAHGYFYRAQYYLNRFDKQKCEDDVSRAIQLYPNFAAAYRLRGILHLEQNKRNDAIADFRRALELDANDSVSQQKLTRLRQN